MATRIDAIRFVPASWDPWQGRVRGGGLFGTDYAVAISAEQAESAPRTLGGERLANTARRYPYTWVVVHPSTEMFASISPSEHPYV